MQTYFNESFLIKLWQLRCKWKHPWFPHYLAWGKLNNTTTNLKFVTISHILSPAAQPPPNCLVIEGTSAPRPVQVTTIHNCDFPAIQILICKRKSAQWKVLSSHVSNARFELQVSFIASAVDDVILQLTIRKGFPANSGIGSWLSEFVGAEKR